MGAGESFGGGGGRSESCPNIAYLIFMCIRWGTPNTHLCAFSVTYNYSADTQDNFTGPASEAPELEKGIPFPTGRFEHLGTKINIWTNCSIASVRFSHIENIMNHSDLEEIAGGPSGINLKKNYLPFLKTNIYFKNLQFQRLCH